MTTWSYDANLFILLGLRGYQKLFWNPRNSISWESPNLHQTNSMWQAILSNLLVPCWFQFHSVHHAESIRQANLFCLLVTHWRQPYSYLTTALNTTISKATIATLPAPHIDHLISDLTREVQYAILPDDFPELKLLNNLYAQKFKSEPEALKFDPSDLFTARTCAHKIINSSSPVPNSYSPSPPPTPSAGFKPPRIEIPKWSGKNYDFYT